MLSTDVVFPNLRRPLQVGKLDLLKFIYAYSSMLDELLQNRNYYCL